MRDEPPGRPGEGPDTGWQLWASHGKRGDKGAPGDRGERGAPGPAGTSIVEAVVDGYALILGMSDGAATVADLRPVLERYHEERR